MKNLIALILLSLVSTHANAFLVTDFDGKRISVHDYIGDGRWTVVMLWSLNCVLCEKQKPAIEAFHNKHKQSNAHVLGLVTDGHEYISQIEQFMNTKPVAFPSLVVFGDVFNEQVMKETGKPFPTSPGYLVYSPDGQLELAINNRVEIDELLGYLETQFK